MAFEQLVAEAAMKKEKDSKKEKGKHKHRSSTRTSTDAGESSQYPSEKNP